MKSILFEYRGEINDKYLSFDRLLESALFVEFASTLSAIAVTLIQLEGDGAASTWLFPYK